MFRVTAPSITLAFAACTLQLGGEGDALRGNDSERDGAATAPDADVTAGDATPGEDTRTEAPWDASADVTTDASDSAAEDSAADVALDVAVDAGPLVQLRYNVNGPAYVALSGPAAGVWTADPGAGGICGPSYFSVSNVSGTNDTPLYTGEAFGDPLTCSVGAGALPAGAYDVTLFFAEIYYGAGCAGGGGGTGARVFDIELEGQTVEDDLDVFALAGGCAAATGSMAQPVVRKYRVTIADGTLNVRMPADADNAKISALAVEGPF